MGSGAPSVEVVVRFDGVVQVVRHLVYPAPGFAVGDEPGADVPLNGARARVRAAAGGYELVFPTGTTGERFFDGERATLEELIARGEARSIAPNFRSPSSRNIRRRPSPDFRAPPSQEFCATGATEFCATGAAEFCVAVPTGASVRVTLGAVELEVTSSLPPTRRALGPRPDFLQLAVTGATAAMFSFAAITILAIPYAPRPDFLLRDKSIKPAHFIFPSSSEPPATAPPPFFVRDPDAPRARPREPSHRAEPARARDAKISRTPGRSTEARRAPASRDEIRRAAGERAQRAIAFGVLSDRAGSQIGSIFGSDSALGADARAALDALTDAPLDRDSSAGFDDLRGGLIGPIGSGGGGRGEGTIGLGTIGTIGRSGWDGRTDGGFGHGALRPARDSGYNIIGGPEIVPFGRAICQKPRWLDGALIRRVLRQRAHELWACHLEAGSDGDAHLTPRFTIGADGRVLAAAVGGSKLSACVSRVMRGWEFPRPRCGAVMVSFPLNFSNAASPSR